MLNAVIFIVVILFVTPLVGFLFGAFSGLVVGLFFGGIILEFFRQIGIDGLAMWEIGGALGFIGGYFKTVVSK